MTVMDNLGVFMFELKISDDTYSTALSARAEDIIFKYVKDLEQAGSGEAFKNVLYGIRVMVEGRNRFLNDLAEVIAHEDTDSKFTVRVHRPDLTDQVVQTLKDADYPRSKREPGTNDVTVIISHKTDQQLEDMANDVKRMEKSALGAATGLKLDTLQRIKAAIDKEYIEPKDAFHARNQIEQTSNEINEFIKVLSLKKRYKFLDDDLDLSDPEEKRLFGDIHKPQYRSYFK